MQAFLMLLLEARIEGLGSREEHRPALEPSLTSSFPALSPTKLKLITRVNSHFSGRLCTEHSHLTSYPHTPGCKCCASVSEK